MANPSLLEQAITKQQEAAELQALLDTAKEELNVMSSVIFGFQVGDSITATPKFIDHLEESPNLSYPRVGTVGRIVTVDFTTSTCCVEFSGWYTYMVPVDVVQNMRGSR